MANPTTNYAFAMPTNTDLVKDLPADFEIFGQAVDTQMKTNADAAIAKTIVDAKGDIIAATAADTVSRLAVGANDTVLTADSSTATGLKWAAPASGGMTLISTTSLTGASTTIGSIPGTYNSLFLLIYGVTNATADSYFICKPNNSASGNVYQDGVSGAVESIYGNAYFNLGGTGFAISRTSADNCFGLNIDNYASSTNYKVVQGSAVFVASGATKKAFSWGGGWADNTAITSLVLSNLGGNLSTGTALLYGVK